MKRKIVYMVLVTVFLLLPLNISQGDQDCLPTSFFSLTFLSTNEGPSRSPPQWVVGMTMENILPKIAIGIDFHETTSLTNVGYRTWNYPYIEYDHIPTYNEGGYDILIIGERKWDFDLNLAGKFDTTSFGPITTNYYQYSNPTYDSVLAQYMVEQDPFERTLLAHDLQAILYEDIPSIPVVCLNSIYGFRNRTVGIDELLLANSYHRAEYWDNTENKKLTFAIPYAATIPDKTHIPRFSNYNLFLQDNYEDGLWMQAVYGGLFERNLDTHYWEPSIASSYLISADKKNITVVIDSNAKFSDGNPVLAEDVKYSYDLFMSPISNSEIREELTEWFASNDSIQVVNSTTINFNMTQINNFPLGSLSYGIIDKSEVEPLVSTFGLSIFSEEPLGGNVIDKLVKSCGPFVFADFNKLADHIKLIPNPYWNNLTSSNGLQPNLDEINFISISGKDNAVNALISGAIDIMDESFYPALQDFEEDANVKAVFVEDLTQIELAMNMKHPVFGTGELTPQGNSEAAKMIRKAISHAVPREIIAENLGVNPGTPGVTPVPKGVIGFDDSLVPYEYNLDLAFEYMSSVSGIVQPTCATTPTLTFPTFTIGYELMFVTVVMIIGLSTLYLIRRWRLTKA